MGTAGGARLSAEGLELQGEHDIPQGHRCDSAQPYCAVNGHISR